VALTMPIDGLLLILPVVVVPGGVSPDLTVVGGVVGVGGLLLYDGD